MASVLRAGMALMDTDSDNYVSAAELRTYAAKVPPMIRFAPPPLVSQRLPPVTLVSQRLPSVSSTVTAKMPRFERRHLLTPPASLDAAAEIALSTPMFLRLCLTSSAFQAAAFSFAIINLEVNAIKQVWHGAAGRSGRKRGNVLLPYP